METCVILLIILGAISGVSRGVGVLPDTFIAAVGEKVMFTTKAPSPGTSILIVTWGFQNKSGVNFNIITSSTEDIIGPGYKDRIFLLRATGSLELRNLTLSDSGEYRVTIIPTAAAQLKGSCKLVVLAPISNVTVTASSRDLVEFNSSVRLSCSVSSGSSVSFLWLNGSSEVTAGDRVQLTDGGSTLTISSVSRYDQGPFRCNVFNPISNGTSDSLNLSINYGPENVNLTLSPLQENYVQGSNISLTCSAVSRPAASLYWFLNGDLLSDTGPELRLVNLQMSQSGNYSCQAFNNKTLRSRTAQLSAITVLAPISNIEVNASHTDLMEFSSSVRLSCSVSSGSSPSFSWLNGSSEVTAGDRVQLSDGNTTLTIVNVTRYDRGPFRCHVLNPVSGGTSEPVNIFVIFGPEHVNLTRSPSQPYYDEGTDISLICSAVSSPAALIHWFLNGDLLFDTGAELRLIDVQISHSGNYSCQAFNNITMRNLTSLPVALTVLKSHISNVIITPNNTDLVESSSVSLSCSSSGSFPSFLWLNGSSEVKASDRLHFTDEGATLTIISVTRYDQGPFRCHVFNNFSDYTSDPVKLSIGFGPENTHLQLSPSQQHYERGSNITVACSAVSRPAALFYWFLNGDLLTDAGPELRLMNLQMSQSGNYSCQAFNNKTLIYEMSPPSVVSVLAPVSSVVVTSNNTVIMEFNSSVRLSCSVSSGSSVSFLWLNRSSEVTASDRVQLTDGGSSLTISSVTRYDQGPFRCNVSNGISHGLSQSVNLVVQYGPDAVSVVGPKSVRVGDMTMLYCSAASVPSPTFTWLFKMKPTNVHEAVYVIQSSRNADSGTYTCTAENTVTGQSQTAHHELTLIDFSECDCSAAVGRAVLVSAGCCLLIVGVLGIMLYCLMRRKSNYPAHQKEKLSVKEKHSDVYKITESMENGVYSLPLKQKK